MLVGVLFSRIAAGSGSALYCNPVCVARSLLAHDAVAVAVPGAGYHPLRETPTVAFGPLNSDFPCRLSRVAGVVPDRLGCLNWWLRGNDRWSSLALACHHRRRGIAGVYHLDQSVVLVLRDGQVPGILYPDPVNSVLAPVGSIFRFPIFGSSSALGTVCAGRDGDQVLGIVQIDCEAFAFCG